MVNLYQENECDLYQWYHGSKLCTTILETLITMEEDDSGLQYIEVKLRGPRLTSQESFYFFELLTNTILMVRLTTTKKYKLE